MKPKPTIILFIGIIASFFVEGQTMYQYFDGADTSAQNSILINIDNSPFNIWEIGEPQKDIFHESATFPNSLITDTDDYYPPNNTSSFSFKLHPEWFGWWGILALQWKQKLNMDHTRDGGIIEVSMDSGNSWENAFNSSYVYNFYGYDEENKDMLQDGQWAFTGTDSTWKDIWLCYDLSWLSYNDSAWFRFTFVSDSVDTQKEGWQIDNLIVHETIIHTVNEVEQKKYMTVSPNPTDGRINIETKKLNEFHIIEYIDLINSDGKVVQQWGISPTKFFIDIGHHPDGVYFLKIKTNKKYESFKVILKS